MIGKGRIDRVHQRVQSKFPGNDPRLAGNSMDRAFDPPRKAIPNRLGDQQSSGRLHVIHSKDNRTRSVTEDGSKALAPGKW